MIDRMLEHLEDFFPFYIIAGALVVVLVIALFVEGSQIVTWEDTCEGQGGYVRTLHQSNVGIGFDGKTSIVPSTTRFCLSADGRILDIR